MRESRKPVVGESSRFINISRLTHGVSCRIQGLMVIYKIFRADEWALLVQAGETAGAPIDIADGFVHFSTAEQVAETAAKHFAGVDDLILCTLEADNLDMLKWEPSRGGALFPHLYRPLRINDILWDKPLPLLDGAHVFPDDVL